MRKGVTMKRARILAMTACLLVIASACAEGETRATPQIVPTTTPTTMVVPAAAGQGLFTPVADRLPAPMVSLSTGEVAGLFESFDHTNFTAPATIDNPWLPLIPGTRLVYEGFTEEDGEVLPHRLVLTVTDLVKVIDGVPSLVAWDVDWSDGDLVETELAFYAQDDDGTVWRMGEYPEEWEEGEFIEAPAWLAGIADARAGIAMRGAPDGTTSSYSQGWGPAVEFTDRAFLFEQGVSTCVRLDCYSNVLVMNEFNEEEPGAHQLKYYAWGIGNVQVGWRGDDTSIEELELVEIVRLTEEEMAKARDAALTLDQRAYIISPDVYGLTDPITAN